MSTHTLQNEKTTLQRFAAFIESIGVEAEVIDCGRPTLTVSDAAEAVKCEPDQIIKTILFHDGHGQFVIAIAAGHSRIDKSRLVEVSGLQTAKLASPAMVLEQLGYAAGGVPPIDLPETIPVVIDHAAAGLSTCYAGAGSTSRLVRLDPRDIVRHNDATVADIIETP